MDIAFKGPDTLPKVPMVSNNECPKILNRTVEPIDRGHSDEYLTKSTLLLYQKLNSRNQISSNEHNASAEILVNHDDISLDTTKKPHFKNTHLQKIDSNVLLDMNVNIPKILNNKIDVNNYRKSI